MPRSADWSKGFDGRSVITEQALITCLVQASLTITWMPWLSDRYVSLMVSGFDDPVQGELPAQRQAETGVWFLFTWMPWVSSKYEALVVRG